MSPKFIFGHGFLGVERLEREVDVLLHVERPLEHPRVQVYVFVCETNYILLFQLLDLKKKHFTKNISRYKYL